MSYFFDTHFHVMELNHPDFIGTVQSMEGGIPEVIQSGLLSSSYIMTPQNAKGQFLYSLMNSLNAFEQSIDKTFVMMEKDLSGAFLRKDFDTQGVLYPEVPYMQPDGLHFRNRVYDRMLMMPLVMDFSRDPKQWNKTYYQTSQGLKIVKYADDTLAAIDAYFQNNRLGKFDFMPFVGINTGLHNTKTVQMLLEKYVSTSPMILSPVSHGSGSKRFSGVKVYPPLGMNPWPEHNKEEMKSVRTLYDFCTQYDIPITTHCDSQGFKNLPAKKSVQYTSPLTWEKALKEYPTLRLDFAHFGYQYTVTQDVKNIFAPIISLPLTGEWFTTIIRLMQEYENVYTDLSFTGCMPEFFVQLQKYLETMEEGPRKTVLSKIMFGSDFSVNLMKVQSYLSYYKTFDDCPFSDEDVFSFANTNPLKYMKI